MIVCLLDLVCLHALAYDVQVTPLPFWAEYILPNYIVMCACAQ